MTLPKTKNSLASKVAKPQKLKCILAQPFAKYRPVISFSDAELFCNVITKSNWKTKCTIGLSSCLRKTNNSSEFSCLLISSKIKPFFVSWQIIHSIAVREKIPKVFCFPNLEELTLNLFRKKSLALLLPTCAELEIHSWLSNQQLLNPIPKNLLPVDHQTFDKIVKEKEFTPSFNLQDLYLSSSDCQFQVPTIVKRKNPLTLAKVDKSWSGDFISFGDVEMKDADHIDSEEEKDNLQSMLRNISKKSSPIKKKTIQKETPKDESWTIKELVKTPLKEPSDDEFLGDYIGVTVHKIQKNPDKVKKKKKKKGKSLKS